MLKTYNCRQDVGFLSEVSLQVLGTSFIAPFLGGLAACALNGGFEIELPKGFPIKRMGELPDTTKLRSARRTSKFD